MTKLKDILTISHSNVVIMDAYDEVIETNYEYDTWKNFSKDFLNREVEEIDTRRDENVIRVWLADMKEVKGSV